MTSYVSFQKKFFLLASSLSFDPDSYTVLEGGSAMLTVVLSTPLDEEVTVQVSTTGGTATSKSKPCAALSAV